MIESLEEEEMEEVVYGDILQVAKFCNQHSFSGKNLNLQLPVNIV